MISLHTPSLDHFFKDAFFSRHLSGAASLDPTTALAQLQLSSVCLTQGWLVLRDGSAFRVGAKQWRSSERYEGGQGLYFSLKFFNIGLLASGRSNSN